MKYLEIVVLFFVFICGYVTVRNRHYVTKSAIPPPELSGWAYLYQNGDDYSFIELTGFDRATFLELHSVIFDDIPWRTGRIPKLDTKGKN